MTEEQHQSKAKEIFDAIAINSKPEHVYMAFERIPTGNLHIMKSIIDGILRQRSISDK